MKHIVNILGGIVGLLLLGSCEKQHPGDYNDGGRIYFYNEPKVQQDSINVSFFAAMGGNKYDTVWIDVRAMGYPADQDRPLNLQILNEGEEGAAVAGKHYVGFDDPGMKPRICMPAGEVKTNIPVVWIKDPSLNTSEVRLELSLEANEYFQRGYEPWCQFVVTATAKAVQPFLWDTWWKTYFGDWGPRKMEFIILYVGFNEFDEIPSDYALCPYLQGKAKQKLKEYNENPENEDAPLTEEDGTPVEF